MPSTAPMSSTAHASISHPSIVPEKSSRHAVPAFLVWFITCLLGGLLAACGGGGSSDSQSVGQSAPVQASSTPEQGEVIISITDAPGDFITYEVAVTQIELTRQNGDVVSALPLSTRVDFAELTEVTELLSIATVPAGVYTSASLTLDFSTADVLVQGDAGDAVAATLLDADGNPPGVLQMRLELEESNQIRIARGRPAAFSLDFDLGASNSIDLDTTPPTVSVEPFLLATPELETGRTHRVRGLLAAVTQQALQFEVAVRPFHHRSGKFGNVTLTTNDSTAYEIDGVAYTGAEGLAALDAIALRSPMVAHGQIQVPEQQSDNERYLLAEQVLAGSSVLGVETDLVRGVVVARTGDTLTVRGASIERGEGTPAFRGELTVRVSPQTPVSAPSAGQATLTSDSISVGQRLLASGELRDDRTLVAERVRLPLASFTAEVVSASPLAVDLFFLNGRRPGIYDFSGTGTAPDTDADPDNYEVDSALMLPGDMTVGDLIRTRGLVNEFGLAPADFLARTLINVQTDSRAATLKVGWVGGTTTPFNATSPPRLDVNLIEARTSLKLQGVPRGFVELMESLALTAPDTDRGVYAVMIRGSNELAQYRRFSDLVTALIAQLDAGNALHRMTAQGRYTRANSELVTRRAGFVFSTGQTDG